MKLKQMTVHTQSVENSFFLSTLPRERQELQVSMLVERFRLSLFTPPDISFITGSQNLVWRRRFNFCGTVRMKKCLSTLGAICSFRDDDNLGHF